METTSIMHSSGHPTGHNIYYLVFNNLQENTHTCSAIPAYLKFSRLDQLTLRLARRSSARQTSYGSGALKSGFGALGITSTGFVGSLRNTAISSACSINHSSASAVANSSTHTAKTARWRLLAFSKRVLWSISISFMRISDFENKCCTLISSIGPGPFRGQRPRSLARVCEISGHDTFFASYTTKV